MHPLLRHSRGFRRCAVAEPYGSFRRCDRPSCEREREDIRRGGFAGDPREGLHAPKRCTRARIENRDPHHEAFEAEEPQRELGPRGERRVAFGLRAAKMRERFMAAIVLAEDERRGAAALEKHHVIRLRERDPARPKRERPIEARGPEEVRGGDATISEEQIVALALVLEERRRRTWMKNERAPWATSEHQGRESFTRVPDTRGVERIQGEGERALGRERIARAAADPRDIFPDVQPPIRGERMQPLPDALRGEIGEHCATELIEGEDAAAPERQEHVTVPRRKRRILSSNLTTKTVSPLRRCRRKTQ